MSLYISNVYAYDRTEYGIWESKGCLNTREVALIRYANKVNMSLDNCRVLGGEWYDEYTNTIITESRIIDIDHIVPLKYIDDIKGKEWDRATKHRFGNDLMNLAITRASLNRSKGNKGPSKWLPPVNKCMYIMSWKIVGREYNIVFPEADQKIIDSFEGCE